MPNGSTHDARLDRIYLALKLGYGLVPIAAGADKFLNLLTDWTNYLPKFVTSIVPLEPKQFMMVVGIIEIIAGVVVLSKLTRLGAAVVAAWLVLISLNVALAGFLDIAVRDLVMALGAYTLATLAAVRGDGWLSARPANA
ncbi:MAG: DoxX family membrane protein [Phycisphaerales bacterium]